MTGTNSWEPINPGYRLAQTGKTFPGDNFPTVPRGVTEVDCRELCRAETGCKGWGFIWDADLSANGNCNLKSKINKGPLNEKRSQFVARWKGGQMMHIDKGSLCPGGHLYIHTYVKPDRLNDAPSFTGERITGISVPDDQYCLFSWSGHFEGRVQHPGDQPGGRGQGRGKDQQHHHGDGSRVCFRVRCQ